MQEVNTQEETCKEGGGSNTQSRVNRKVRWGKGECRCVDLASGGPARRPISFQRPLGIARISAGGEEK